MTTLWSVLSILNLISSNIYAQHIYCKGTCVCMEETMACVKPGLHEIPSPYSVTIVKLILKKQTFTHHFLARENFSAIMPPIVNLTQLSIRQSNIYVIKPETFIDLKKLKNLDLAMNFNLTVQSRSFYGLNLTVLKLDNNKNLKFERNSFEGLIVQSLHLSHSTIKEIPYLLLKPILSSLTTLFLDNNSIMRIDPRYQVYFKNLKVLNLLSNPLSCSCSMKWLTEVYIYRRKNDKLTKGAFQESIEISPSCNEPLYMKGKYLHELSLSMFDCDIPTLTQLKVDFQSVTHTELSCSATQNINEAQISIEWFTEMIQGINKKLSSIFQPIEEIFQRKVRTETVLITKHRTTDSFQCIAKNENGNTTATVRINWPPVEKMIETDKISDHNSNDGFQKPDEEYYLFQKRFTLLEMLGAVIGTFSLTLLIFFLIYKLFFLNRQLNRKSIAPPNGYMTYEAAVYSDSQTYDVPGNAYLQSVLLPMPHLSSTPDHFLDFKTQERFYQTN